MAVRKDRKFRLEVCYIGQDDGLNKEAERLAGRAPKDGGYDPANQVRKLSFVFDTEKTTDEARSRFLKTEKFKVIGVEAITSGKWLVDVWVDNRRIRKLLPDKRTAELVEKDLKIKEARGELLGICPIKNVTFEAFSKDYLKYVETNLSEGRYRIVESTVRFSLVPFFGPRSLKDITPKLVEDFKAQRARNIKASSANELLSILRAMLNLAVKWNHVKASPFKAVKLMKVDRVEPPHLAVEEATRLLDACRGDRHLYTFTAIGLHTGLRIGEIINLTWADVDLRRGIVKVRAKTEAEGVNAWRTKTGDIRDIPVNDFLADVLSRHPRHISSPYVLHNPDGSPYAEHVARRGLERASNGAGLSVHVHPHMLRHSFGTALAANGVDVVTIQKLMGHADVKMTTRPRTG